MQEVLTESAKNIVGNVVGANSLTSRLTYEEFLEWNGSEGWFEWFRGEIIDMSSPSVLHQEVLGFLFLIISNFLETKKYGKVFVAPLQMKLEKSGRQPDLLFVSNQNLKNLKKNYLDGAADLIIEIISPESRSRDRGDKFYEYETAGVKEYWLIDFERKQAEFYVLKANGIFEFIKVDSVFYSKVLEGLFVKTDWLWQKELPNLMDVLKEWKII